MPAKTAALSASLLVFIASPLTSQLRLLGTGCASKHGNRPRLTAEHQPAPGTTTRLLVDTCRPAANVILYFGTSLTRWAGQALPIDLTRFGLPGCMLRVAADIPTRLTADASGLAAVAVKIPNLKPGKTGYLQAFVYGGSGTNQWHGMSETLAVSLTTPLERSSIAVLPDSQRYVEKASLAHHFTAQTNWIIRNKTNRSIAFVSHVGDVAHNGGLATEWTRANAAFASLDGDLSKMPDGLVPYSAVLGNHDYDTTDNKSAATVFLKHVGPGRFRKRTWFAGASADGRNQAQVFRAGGADFLHIGLEWLAGDKALAWAQSVIDSRPQLPALLTTHAYLDAGAPTEQRRKNTTSNGAGNNAGVDIYRKLVEPNPNIFLVLCGHAFGEGKLTSTTGLGATVHQLLSNYQGEANGGNGWLRLYEFDAAKKLLRAATISPTFKPGTTKGKDHNSGASSHFTLPFDFAAHRARLATQRVLHFRNGQAPASAAPVYRGAVDTYIGNGTGSTSASASYGNAQDVISDGNGDNQQGLLRFDGLLGTGPGQIRRRSRIVSAILTITTEGATSSSVDGSRFYRMKKVWSSTSTWNSLVVGVQTGTETELIHDADSKGKVTAKGTRSLDVTKSVQAWVNGTSNHGWAILCNGPDAWRFRSSNWSTLAERPMLTVVY